MNNEHIDLNELLFSFSKALDFVEAEFLGIITNHGKRTAYISMQLCKHLGYSEADVFDMAAYAVLHDNALTKCMFQSTGDFMSMENLKIHCQMGEENVRNFPFQRDVSGVILYHHENWDGSGFYRLKGDAIPVKAAILRLADNMDFVLHMGDARAGLGEAMRSHAIANKGTLYAPKVVDALEAVLSEKFIQGMANASIDASLYRELPRIGQYLSTQKLVEACGIFSLMIGSKSYFTKIHSQGAANKAAYMGKVFGLDQTHCDKLKIAGNLHDVGKLAIPSSIIEKPGPLTDDEFSVMQHHATYTRGILQNVEGLREICAWAANHHERLDGSGYLYANRTKGLDFGSRLVACCDVYQALIEDRPYRAAMSHKKAIGEMSKLVEQGKIDGNIVAAIDREGLRSFNGLC